LRLGGRSRSWGGPLFALFAAAVALTPAEIGAQAAPIGPLEVRNLDFEGNTAFPDDSLRFAIVNRETECKPILLPLCLIGIDFAFDREYLVRRELENDQTRVRLYYWMRGYPDAAVDTTVSYGPNDVPEVRLTFHVSEGEPVLVSALTFTGDNPLPEGELLGSLPLQVGDIFSRIRYDEAYDSLVTRLRNEGYVHADVFRSSFVPAGSHQAQITFDVDAGPRARIGPLDIRVSGPAELSLDVVRRMLPFTEGDLYSEANLRQGQRNLYGLEIVRNALIAADTVRMAAGPDTLVPLIVQVGTNTLHRVRTGGGWNWADCLSAESRWVSRNYLGGAERLQVSGKISNLLADQLHDDICPLSGIDEFGGLNWSLTTELNLPRLFSPRNSFSTSLVLERQSVTDVFIRQSVGMNAVLTRSLAVRMPLALSYRPQRTKLEAAAVFFCTSLLVCNPEDVDVLQAPNWLSPAGAAISIDRTNNLLNPSAGYLAHFDTEVASFLTLSDFAYTRLAGDVSNYIEFAPRSIFAWKLRGGWIGAASFVDFETASDVIHPQKRFFAGGASSVRGFPQNRLGPRVLTVDPADLLGYAVGTPADTVLVGACSAPSIADFTCDASPLGDDAFTPRPTGGTRFFEGSVEARLPLATSFQAALFLDFGQVWAERTDVDFGKLEWTPGMGVRYFSPIGPLRVDVAYRGRGGELLPVVTPRLRPYQPGVDAKDDRVEVPLRDGEGREVKDANGDPATYRVPWVPLSDLALLTPRVLFGDQSSFFRRLQLHFSIGQAF
jgi:outer membrane protein insertion porin family